MSDLIDISGMSKPKVLAALYNASKPQGMGILAHDPSKMGAMEAADLLSRDTYFDYLKGRVIKVDLSGDTFDPWFYDRDLGEGAAARAIAGIE